MYKSLLLIITIILTLSLSYSCNKETQDEIDQELIENYIIENNIDAVKHSSGLWYEIMKQGNSTYPVASSKVNVNYSGYLLDGNEFDSGNSVEFYLSQVIEGWEIGIPLVSEGGEILLIIPSELGYGDNKVGDIPKNSVMIFEVKLNSVL